MEKGPKGPYVYQPYGVITHPELAKAGRLFGVGGTEEILDKLTRAEAEAIVKALKNLTGKG